MCVCVVFCNGWNVECVVRNSCVSFWFSHVRNGQFGSSERRKPRGNITLCVSRDLNARHSRSSILLCVCVYLAGAAAPTNGRVSFLPPFYFWFFSSYFCVKKQRENREEENWAWQEKLWASGCFIDAHREKKNKYLSILFFFFFLGRFLFCFSTKQSPGVFWIGAGHKNSKLCGAVSCASPSMFGFFSRTS